MEWVHIKDRMPTEKGIYHIATSPYGGSGKLLAFFDGSGFISLDKKIYCHNVMQWLERKVETMDICKLDATTGNP